MTGRSLSKNQQKNPPDEGRIFSLNSEPIEILELVVDLHGDLSDVIKEIISLEVSCFEDSSCAWVDLFHEDHVSFPTIVGIKGVIHVVVEETFEN